MGEQRLSDIAILSIERPYHLFSFRSASAFNKSVILETGLNTFVNVILRSSVNLMDNVKPF